MTKIIRCFVAKLDGVKISAVELRQSEVDNYSIKNSSFYKDNFLLFRIMKVFERFSREFGVGTYLE